MADTVRMSCRALRSFTTGFALASSIGLTIGLTIGLAGCYTPTFPEGIACSLEGKCPSTQFCDVDNRCYSEPGDRGGDGGVVGDARLTGLGLSVGTLEPAFDPAVTSYTVKLGLRTDSVAVMATAEDGATIRIDGSEVASGEQSGAIGLVVGNNAIAVTVTIGSETSTYQLELNLGAGVLQNIYAKGSNADAGDSFGRAIAVTEDRLIVGAPFEDSRIAMPADNSVSSSGGVYIFVRDGNGWAQEAFLKASNPGLDDRFGSSLAIDGDTLVVGAPREASIATGVGGDQNDDSRSTAGAAYVFVRSGSTWNQQAYLKASNSTFFTYFGGAVAVSGNTVVVGAIGDNSGATGVNGPDDNFDANDSGAAYVFLRSGASWSTQAYLKASNTGADDEFGTSVAISGNTVAVGVPREDSNGVGVNGQQSNNDAPESGATYVFERSGTTWAQTAYLKQSTSKSESRFGESLSFGGDTLVVGANRDSSSATGVNGNEDDGASPSAGAVYVFEKGTQVGNRKLS